MSVRPQRRPFADRLRKGLVEGIEFARGERELVTVVVPVPRTYSGADVALVRRRRGMSQVQFARLLAVSLKTLQSWEQGRRKPSKPTQRLIQIVDQPQAFESLLVCETEVGGLEVGAPPNPLAGAEREPRTASGRRKRQAVGHGN